MPDFDRAKGHGFHVTPNDDQYIQHPETAVLVISKGISLSAEADIKVQFDNGLITVIPSGILAAGVRHDLKIKRLYATGTGSTDVFVWLL